MQVIARPVHFEDFSGADFERLVFAYHVRAGWVDVEWYGQTGSDLGRDIIGAQPFDGGPTVRTVIQCVNRADLAMDKAAQDMAKAVGAPTGRPESFRFVCRGAVSAARRDAIRATAAKLAIRSITIWSGVEFEEHLRLRAEDLLRRFCDGERFPDDSASVRRFVDDFPGLTDQEALSLMAAAFDRPAFRTRFQSETNLPAFQQAIEDTIRALNTGLWRTREGADIRRIPSMHNLTDVTNRAAVARTVERLDLLRGAFVGHMRGGRIKRCQCGQADCPTFFTDSTIAHELDRARQRLLAEFQAVLPSFDVDLRCED